MLEKVEGIHSKGSALDEEAANNEQSKKNI